MNALSDPTPSLGDLISGSDHRALSGKELFLILGIIILTCVSSHHTYTEAGVSASDTAR